MLGVGLLYTAIIAFILFLLSLSFGCSTTPKEPVAMEEETIVRYGKGSVERSRGIIARTQNGNFLVSSGYVTWAENLKIDLDAALAKLEQERISKLAK